jgi:hypothetical protein
MISVTFLDFEAGLDAEAGTAAAAGGSIGVGDLEGRTSKILDIIHLAALDQSDTDRVNDQRNAVRDSLDVTFFGFAQRKAVGKAGAATTVDRKPKDGRLALLFGNVCYAPCGAG